MNDIIIIIPMILIFVLGYFAVRSIDRFISENVSDDEQPNLLKEVGSAASEITDKPAPAQLTDSIPVLDATGKCIGYLTCAMQRGTKSAWKH